MMWLAGHAEQDILPDTGIPPWAIIATLVVVVLACLLYAGGR